MLTASSALWSGWSVFWDFRTLDRDGTGRMQVDTQEGPQLSMYSRTGARDCPLIAFLWELPWPLPVSRRADPVCGHTFRSLSILLALAPSQGPTCFNRPCPQGHPTPAHPITHPLHPLSCTCALINTCVASTPSLSSGTITSVPSHPFHYHLGGEIQAITGPRASMPLSVFCSQPARPRRKYMHPSCCCF